MTALADRLRRALPATPAERAAALWSFGYFFMLLASYYVLRPLRDRMGIEGGVKALPWLFTATFVTLLLAQPLYGALVAKLSRARFVPIVYQFFAANLACSAACLRRRARVRGAGLLRLVSVFNLFAVAVFWSFMADLFRGEGQAPVRLHRRGRNGGRAARAADHDRPLSATRARQPLLVALVFLELAVPAFIARAQRRGAARVAAGDDRPIGGRTLAGLAELARSPHLLGMAAGALFARGHGALPAQAQIVAGAVHGAGEQTRVFASVDLAVGLLTLATQVFATGRLLRRFGTGVAAASLPGVYLVGFTALAVAPGLAVVLVFQVVQRWVNFAVANPARQVFFTVVDREAKYKAKNVIDVVVYRGSDAASSWLFESLQALGWKLGAIALAALPPMAGWLMLSNALGRLHEQRAARQARRACGTRPDRRRTKDRRHHARSSTPVHRGLATDGYRPRRVARLRSREHDTAGEKAAHPHPRRHRLHRAAPGALRTCARTRGDAFQSRSRAAAMAGSGRGADRRPQHRRPEGAGRPDVGRLHRQPDHAAVRVRDAGRVPQGRIGHYVFISTISVYAANDKAEDESAALVPYAGQDAMAETAQSLRGRLGELYGPLKAASEQEAARQFPGALTIIRPGLIVGPGDETDRFTYWPVRLARGGEVLAPGDGSDPVQFIDARDLAEWTIRMVESRTLGVFNATGPDRPLSMEGMLAGIAIAIRAEAHLVWVPTAFSQPSGSRPGATSRSGCRRKARAPASRGARSAALRAGLAFRPLRVLRPTRSHGSASNRPEHQAKLRAGLAGARVAVAGGVDGGAKNGR
jgi:AAA family ATP:ADP antiporter